MNLLNPEAEGVEEAMDLVNGQLNDLSMLSDFTGSDSRAHQSTGRSSNRASKRLSQKNKDLLSNEFVYILLDAHQLNKRVKSESIKLGLQVFTYEEVQELGRIRCQGFYQILAGSHQTPSLNLNLIESNNALKPEPETWAGIIYSSGTTGMSFPSPPKIKSNNLFTFG